MDAGYLSDVPTYDPTRGGGSDAVASSEISQDLIVSTRHLEQHFKDKYVRLRQVYEQRIRQLTDVVTDTCASLFTDEMVEGDFKNMRHHHYFKATANGTVMEDEFSFASPHGVLGQMVDRFFLTQYMKRLLQQRNAVIKAYAESHTWKTVLV
jgi:ligand-binding SRPBCC domain-containing protein